jgi:LemA protein
MEIFFPTVITPIVIMGGILTYNKLVKLHNMVKEGWSDIDIQLKLRANLVEIVKGLNRT